MDRTGDAARFGNKVVLCGWVEKVAVVRALAAELKAVRMPITFSITNAIDQITSE